MKRSVAPLAPSRARGAICIRERLGDRRRRRALTDGRSRAEFSQSNRFARRISVPQSNAEDRPPRIRWSEGARVLGHASGTFVRAGVMIALACLVRRLGRRMSGMMGVSGVVRGG